MRKLFALFAMISLLAAGTTSTTYAQDSAEEVSQTDESATQDKAEITQTLKEKFIEGGPFFMSFVLIALIHISQMLWASWSTPIKLLVKSQ